MRVSERLTEYYDAKYSSEESEWTTDVVRPTAHPTNRFEACISVFSSRFSGGDILELGAGSGIVARSLIARKLNFDSYTLTELSDARLRGLLQSVQDPRIRVMKMDAEAIPANAGTYDAVLMIALIEHLVDPLSAMQQVRKMLKPGGFALIDTPNIAKFTRRAKLFLGRFPSTASRNEGLVTYEGNDVSLHDEGHLHYFTFRSLSQMLLRRCGFSKVEKFGYFVGPNGRRLPGHKVGDVLARIWPSI